MTSSEGLLLRSWLTAGVIGTGVVTAFLLPTPPAAWGQLRAAAHTSVHDSHAVNQAALSCGSLLLWALLGWLALGIVVITATELPGRWGAAAERLSRLIVPGLARRVLCGALSVSLASGLLAGPAQAGQRSRSDAAVSGDQGVSRLADTAIRDFDWPPNRPPNFDKPHDGPDSPTADLAPSPEQIVVAPGDCLWNITKRSLGANASERAVALEWPRWWERNRDLIGDNPHLIHPGQRLSAPTPR